MRVSIILAVLLLAGVAHAQVPLPKALADAKTATLINGGIDQRFFDQITEKIVAWHRYELAESDGDLTITIESETALTTNFATGQLLQQKVFNIVFRQGDRVLYRDPLNKGCCKLGTMVEKSLKRFDERMGGK